MTQYMLMYSLGPVQTFIVQARKTRDLSLGSYLLAKLMEAALKELKGDLVYPTDRTVDSERDIPDIPNKFVAIFQSAEEAYDEVEKCTTRIEKRWVEIQDRVWRAIVENHATDDTERIWKRQTNPNSLFETFWVIVPGKPEEYKQWLKHTQQIFDARKRLRDFEPQVDGEAGEKSTISGEREALHGEGSDRKAVQVFWVSLTTNLSPHDISKDGSERLDAIDTIKRFATKSPHIPARPFPSTSSIATASFVERLLTAPIDPDILKKWRAETRELIELSEDATTAIPYLYQMLSKPEVSERRWILRRDGDLYFSETFVPRRLEKDYNVTDTSDSARIAQNGRKALTTLLRDTDDQDIARPTPYYAMIQMDGDKMGVLLSGVENQTEHMKISKALSAFSRTHAPALVEDHYPARLVYAGGDDVFALAPLARDVPSGQGIVTVLDLVNRLREEYHSIVAKPVSDPKRQESVTASTGIAIAHHYTSLSYVRRVTKASEELAKEHYGRNALVVTVIRRSGEQTRVGCHWRYDLLEPEGQPINTFTEFYTLFKQDILSPKCIHILLEEAPVLVKMGVTDFKDTKTPNAQQSEIKRVLHRQRNSSKAGKLPDEQIEHLAWQLVHLAAAMDTDERPSIDEYGKAVELHSEKRRYGLVEVLGWLLVMAFLARKDQE